MKNKKKRIRRVTLIPGWILYIKGRIDARYGVSVVSAYIGGLLKKLCSLGTREIIETEKELYSTRDAAAICLTTISQEGDALSEMPDAAPETSDIAIRANQRNAAATETHRNAISASIRSLFFFSIKSKVLLNVSYFKLFFNFLEYLRYPIG